MNSAKQAKLLTKTIVDPGTDANLAKRSPDNKLGLVDEDQATQMLGEFLAEIGELQERLWAAQKTGLLVVLQGTDTSGKDGVIRHVIGALHPAGVRIASFKAPVGAESQHDYLWRIHQQMPSKGEIVVFNRSHYESLLIERVRGFAPKNVWARRYKHIVNFEKMLADEGTTIVKFMLHISKAEQAQRLQDRLDDPTKLWKFNPGDLEDRKQWTKYQGAYEDAVTKTSTTHAPWHVIPSNYKWVRNVAAATILLDTLRRINPEYPPADFDANAMKIV